MMEWDHQVRSFIRASNKYGVRMIMVGAGMDTWIATGKTTG